MPIPRPEHPRPQFERESWKNLNGQWDFELDFGNSGVSRGLFEKDAVLKGKILVPFCPESALSGIGYTDFIPACWYQRRVTLTETDCAGRLFLHFGAVDYYSEVYVNGKLAGTHKGGYVSFAHDITGFVTPGENVITVRAVDDSRDPMIPSGKQSRKYESYGCYYTRTTGIWQTVWLEAVPAAHIKKPHYLTDIDAGTVTISTDLAGEGTLTVRAFYEGKPMGEATMERARGQVTQTIHLAEKYLWEPGHGRLYDLELTFGEDAVKSYFGLRKLELDGHKFRINGKSVFQRLILDQGFYPDGIYTAPTDEALKRDITMAMDMGFNGARPHEKVFEERYFYYCDKLGYLVWGEYPNWGLDHTDPSAIYGFLPEWLEELDRDRDHPSIVGWCPFNETWDVNGCKQYDDFLRYIYRVTKAVDPTRPCIDVSGGYHVESDLYDVHDYEQDPGEFRSHYGALPGTEIFDRLSPRQKYTGGMFFVSEYGGIGWSVDDSGWSYGKGPRTEEEFKARFKALTDALLDNEYIFGMCYTQLTNVEQEQNGLYTYDRKPKFDPAWVASVVGRKAAIEG